MATGWVPSQLFSLLQQLLMRQVLTSRSGIGRDRKSRDKTSDIDRHGKRSDGGSDDQGGSKIPEKIEVEEHPQPVYYSGGASP